MPRLYVPPDLIDLPPIAKEEAIDVSIEITGDSHRYLSRALRLAPGDAVLVFDGTGREYKSKFVSATAKHSVLQILFASTSKAPSTNITLVQAVIKGERMDWLMQKATELGVSRIIPTITNRVIGKVSEKRQERWRSIAISAAQQSGRADLPDILPAQSFPSALGASLELHNVAADKNDEANKILLWEDGRDKSIHRVLSTDKTWGIFVVGAEGGFTEEEVSLARSTFGFRTASLGPRILRAETAGIAAVALGQAMLGGLDLPAT